MPSLPYIEVTDAPGSAWANRINQNVRTNQLVSSPDFIVKQTTAGTTIRTRQPRTRGTPMVYIDEFDPDSFYDPGDCVRVMPGKTYTSHDGDVVEATAGFYICRVPIPNAEKQPFAGDRNAFKRYLRQDDVRYEPRLDSDGNEPSGLATPNNPNGRYWDRIPMGQLMVSCNNGEEQRRMVDAADLPDPDDDE